MRVGPSLKRFTSSLRATRAVLLVLAAAAARCLTRTSDLTAWSSGLGFADVRLRLAASPATPTAAAIAKVVPWGQLVCVHGSRFQRGSVVRRAHTEARQLNTLLRKARSVQEVLSLLHEEIDNPKLDSIHISTALVRLVKEQSTIDAVVQQSLVVEELVAKLQGWLRKGLVGSWATANIFWAVAKLEKRVPRLMDLMPDLTSMLKLVIDDMNSPNVANVIYACALCDLDPAFLRDLLPLLAERAWFLSQDWNAQDVANIFWATATLKQHEPTLSSLIDLMPVLTEKASTLVGDMIPQHVANIMWASAVLHHFEPSLEFDDMMTALASSLRPALLTRTRAQDLAHMFWGMAVCNCKNEVALAHLSAAVIEQVPRWSAKDLEFDLAQIACALGKLKLMDKPLLRVIAERSSRLLPRMNTWGLCALAWTFDRADAEFRGFQKQLASEVKHRGFSVDMVQRSQLGPDVWYLKFPSERR